MILVFGGTTEGKQVIEALNTLRMAFVYSTKTETNVHVGDFGEYRWGELNAQLLDAFIVDKNIRLIIDAAHPFAVALHRTIAVAAEKHAIQALRFARPKTEEIAHALVHFVDDYDAALGYIECINPSKVFALTGVQSIARLKALWANTETWFRILDRPASVAIAMENAFPKERLLLGYASKSLEEEEKLYEEGAFDCILTKDSGASGALPLKIEAAIGANIPIVILKRPELSAVSKTVDSTGDLVQTLKTSIKA